MLGQDLAEPRRLPGVPHHQAHGETLGTPAADLLGEALELPSEPAGRPRPQLHTGRAPGRGEEGHLDALVRAQQLLEGDGGRRVVGRGVEHGRVVQHDQGVGRQVGGETGAGAAGRAITSSESSPPADRWVVGSNGRSDSTSSPKNSTRTGRAIAGEKMSTIPPLRLHCPTSTTASTRW